MSVPAANILMWRFRTQSLVERTRDLESAIRWKPSI